MQVWEGIQTEVDREKHPHTPLARTNGILRKKKKHGEVYE